jgi:hypothetical protein
MGATFRSKSRRKNTCRPMTTHVQYTVAVEAKELGDDGAVSLWKPAHDLPAREAIAPFSLNFLCAAGELEAPFDLPDDEHDWRLVQDDDGNVKCITVERESVCSVCLWSPIEYTNGIGNSFCRNCCPEEIDVELEKAKQQKKAEAAAAAEKSKPATKSIASHVQDGLTMLIALPIILVVLVVVIVVSVAAVAAIPTISFGSAVIIFLLLYLIRQNEEKTHGDG